MESKYYTPTIEEFHVGFEYEYYEQCLFDLPDKKTPIWINKVFGNEYEELDSVAYDITQTPSTIRIKYLDKEDIESLGWEYVEDRGMSENYGYTFNKPIQYLSGGDAWYKLRYWFTNHRVRIEPLGGPIFDGTIKNKSELKILLKQLGIE